MKALYQFNQYCGRMGSIGGLFIADREAVEGLYGREVYFGEVLGKHSEIVCDIDTTNVVEKSADPVLIQSLLDVFGKESLSGFNPFNYIEEDEEVEEAGA